MGLDITAYRNLTAVADGEVMPEEIEERYGEFLTVYAMATEFPGREAPLVDRGVYRFVESFGFAAGAYSSYSRWREMLAKLAAYEPITTLDEIDAGNRHYANAHPHAASVMFFEGGGIEEQPFYSLVNFSDCEGVLGSDVCVALAHDFAAFQKAADAHPDKWFREKYADWRKACEMAADSGAIEFH